MKKKKAGIALAVLGLTVGFAAVSTTLYINGTATIKADTTDFENNVIFTAATASEGATASISDDGKSITFTTQEFKSIGDTATLNYTITNNSNYKAEFDTPAVVCTANEGLETDYATYLTVTDGKALDGTTLDRNASDDDTLTVSLKQSYTGDEVKTITYTCTIDVDAVEATN